MVPTSSQSFPWDSTYSMTAYLKKPSLNKILNSHLFPDKFIPSFNYFLRIPYLAKLSHWTYFLNSLYFSPNRLLAPWGTETGVSVA